MPRWDACGYEDDVEVLPASFAAMNEAAQFSRPCPVCGSENARPFVTKDGLRLVRCGDCAMIYVTPVPAAMASGEYYDQAGAEYYLSKAKLESDYAAVRFVRELKLFRAYCPQGSVLDVGCSSGAFLYQLRERYPGQYSVLGTDVSGAPLDYAESSGLPVVRGNFLQHDFGGQRFDAVTFWAVLEHLADPKDFLKRARELLKPGGACFILVPNMRSLAIRLLGSRYRYIYAQHLNYFTRATLRKLAEQEFSVVRVCSTHFNPIVIWQDWRQGGREVSNRERAALLERTTAYKQSALMKPLKLAYGIAERALAMLDLADNVTMVLRKRG